MVQCAICGKGMGHKDACHAVNGETFELNISYWKGLHDKYDWHAVTVNPTTLAPIEGQV